jgi:hypothetical protein
MQLEKGRRVGNEFDVENETAGYGNGFFLAGPGPPMQGFPEPHGYGGGGGDRLYLRNPGSDINLRVLPPMAPPGMMPARPVGGYVPRGFGTGHPMGFGSGATQGFGQGGPQGFGSLIAMLTGSYGGVGQAQSSQAGPVQAMTWLEAMKAGRV